MLSSVHFFQSPQEIPGLFDSFFGGLFLVRGLPTFVQMGLLFSFILSFAASFQFTKTSKPLWHRLSALGAFFTLLLSAFLLFQPWDELFINLRHSQHLAEAGTFSFNRFEKIEGIVDFLPFFLLGILNKIGLPLLETNFLMEILAGWFCILAGRRILLNFKSKNMGTWSYPLLVIFPPLLLNTGNGFTVLFFTAFILWALALLVFNSSQPDRWFLGCFLLSLVPLIRLEGIWFDVLLFAFLILKTQHALSRTKIWFSFVIIFLPVFCLSLYRHFYFGQVLPVPIIYKSSIGSLFFMVLGFRNLLQDLVASGSLLFLCLIFFSSREKKANLTLLLLFLFSCPYYVSGGDWFPPAWGRYLFPFSFFCFVYAIAIFSQSFSTLQKESSVSISLLMILAAIILLNPFGSVLRVSEGLFMPRSSLSAIHLKKYGRSNDRINYLSQLGTHLRNNTTARTVIGSSEVATIMFFAKREAVDLLGVTNLDIARSPLRDHPAFFSKVKTENELPHLIFKRTNPSILFERNPGVFYAFDFMLKDLLDTYRPAEVTESDIFLALKRWERKFFRLNETLFGGIEALTKHGYEPVIVKHGSQFISLYFVSRDIRDEHFSQMRKNGMVQSLIKSNHL